MHRALLVLACLGSATAPDADAVELGPIDIHGQATYVRQFKPAFPAAYSGENSLFPERANGYSLTTTLFLGANLTRGWEAYYNLEGAQGVPFSGLHGLGGFNNSELARTSGPDFTVYTARAFIRKTWNISNDHEDVDPEPNQIRTRYASRRIVLTTGKVSALDIFDAIEYSNDGRRRFMNWAGLTFGAWDYPADARGYTWGAALEYYGDGFAVRAGRFAVPRESNGLALDGQIGNHFGDVVEFELPYRAFAGEGILRLLAFRNQAVMGSYNDALAYAAVNGGTPDVADVRKRSDKFGFGVSVQQNLAKYLDGYMRLAWNSGQTETYMFTEIDRSAAAGVIVKGAAWERERDEIGIAVYQNMISGPHRNYLAAGGLGFFLGDGALNYGPERILELYYSLGVTRRVFVSAGYQHVLNPGYNRDRGPVDFFGFRLHGNF